MGKSHFPAQGELSIGPLGTLYRRHGVECYRSEGRDLAGALLRWRFY
jgi:hypothetical protein